MNIYAPGNIMDIKKADSIEIIFINYTEKNSINFQISEGYSLSYNYINVSGNNRNWVGGIFTKLKDIIDTIKPQENWTFKYKTPLFHIAALGIGNIIFPIMFGIMHEIVPVTPDSQLSANVLASRNFLRAYPSVALIIEKLMFPWMMGIGAAYPLRDWLIKLWNNIEFDFGPEHLKLNKQRRQRIFIFGSVIGFPILWDVIKYLFWGR